MEYRALGATGQIVSRICLGTMTFGAQVSQQEGIAIIREAIDRGVNFIDTADVYTNGQSEIITGKAIRDRRESVILASKCGLATSASILDRGLSRSTVIRHVEASLKRLGVDYLDILYLHAPDPNVSFGELVQTMNVLIESEKILHYGVSNFAAWQICSLLYTAKEQGTYAPVVSENVYNMLSRSLDDEVVPCIEWHRLGLTVYNPLAGGLLTGKHRKGSFAENCRLSSDKGYIARYCKEQNLNALNTIIEIASEANLSPVALSYQWLLSKEFITSIICGVSSLGQLEENLAACMGPAPALESLVQCDEIWDDIKGDYYNCHY